MHSLTVAEEEDYIYLTLRGDVDAADLWDLRGKMIPAGRQVDPGFTLIADVSDCQRIQATGTEHIQQMMKHLDTFGLATELRVVSPDTPDRVTAVFDRAKENHTYDIERVASPADDNMSAVLPVTE